MRRKVRPRWKGENCGDAAEGDSWDTVAQHAFLLDVFVTIEQDVQVSLW